jgi:hypothetical protein
MLVVTRSNCQKSECHLQHDLCARLYPGAHIPALTHGSRLLSRLAHHSTTVYPLRADTLYNIFSTCTSVCVAQPGTFGSGTSPGPRSVTNLACLDCVLVVHGSLSVLPMLMWCTCMYPAHASLSLRAHVGDDGHCDSNMLPSVGKILAPVSVIKPDKYDSSFLMGLPP